MYNQNPTNQTNTDRTATRRSPFDLRRALALVVAIGFLLLAVPASPASAAPSGPGGLKPSEEGPVDPPDTDPFDVIVAIPALGSLTAEVTPDCTAGTPVAVKLGNTTQFATLVDTKVDGILVDSQVVGAQMAGYVDLGFTENQTSQVEVTAGTKVLFDSVVSLDCLLPNPSYSITTDCATTEAHAVLKNTGDDTALMGVRYPDAIYMLEEVAPHSSIQWLLGVAPGESIDFDVMWGESILGSEHLDFECAPPATVPPVTVPPATVPPTTVPPTTAAPQDTSAEVADAGEAPAETVADSVSDTDTDQVAGAGSVDGGEILAAESLGVTGPQSPGGTSWMGLWIGGSLLVAGLAISGVLLWAWAGRRRTHAR